MNKVIFIDTLSTGMGPDRCGIYRIGGIVTYDAVEKERFDLKVCPWKGARISEQSLWIGGESRASLVDYPDEKSALSQFTKILDRHVSVKNPSDKAYLAGFNSAGFDVPFLREWFLRCDNLRFRDYFHVQTIDIMCLTALLLMNERPGMPGFHLDTVAHQMGIEYSIRDIYNPVDNAEVCLRIYRKLQMRFGVNECYDETPVETITKNY